MKRIRRFLSILLCVCLVAAPLCPALSEDEVQSVEAVEDEEIITESEESEGPTEPAAPPEAPAEPEPSEAASDGAEESGTEGETTPPEGEPVDPAPGDSQGETGPDAGGGDPSENPPAETGPAPDGEPEANPDMNEDQNPDPDAIDYTQSAAASPAFCQGYAELLPGTAAYAESGAGAEVLGTISGGVVYVLDRSAAEAADRLEVAFDWDGVRYAWIDASRARPMTPDEVTAFVLACAAREDVRTMPDSPELPLDALECTPAAEGSDEPDAAEDDADAEPAANDGEVAASPAAELIVPRGEFVLGVGDSCAIGARFSDEQKYLIVYAPEDGDIVTVSEDGVITALAAGETSIRLHSDFGDAEVRVAVEDAPASVRLVAPRTVVGIGEQIQLKAEFPEGGTTTWKFFSSNDAVATVDIGGIVMPVAAGTATITVETANGLTDSVELTVEPATASIAAKETALEAVVLEPSELTLGVGETRDLPKVVVGEGSCEFSSSDTYYATVDTKKGTFKAVRKTPAGQSVEIRATTGDGVQGAMRLTIVDAPTGVSLSAPRKILGAQGDTVQLAATIKPATAASLLTYTSSNEGVATVDENGVVTSVGAGSAKITVKTFNGKAASVTVTVNAAPALGNLSLNANALTLGVDESFRLTVSPDAAKGCQFESKEESVATVDESGLVTAVGTGAATITARTYNGVEATCEVTVKAAPGAVALDPAEITLGVGDTMSLPAVHFDGDSAGSFEYSTSDSRYATIDGKNGKIKAVRATPAGSPVEIRATAYNGARGALRVTILAAPTGVSLSAPRKTLGADGDAVQLTATVKPAGAAETAKLSYTSSNSGVATVDADGVVTAKGAGSAKITVRTYNQKSAAVTITVKAAPSSVTLNATERTLRIDDGFQLTAKPNTAGSCTFASDRPDIAGVDESGWVTAISPGEAVITATAYNGETAECTVIVPRETPTDPASIALGAGDKLALSEIRFGEGERTFTSDNTRYVTIDAKNGFLKAVRKTPAGQSVQVLVTDAGGEQGALRVTVADAPTGVSLSAPRKTLGADGDAVQLAVTVKPAAAADTARLAYSSDNPNAASVDSHGKITAVGAGKAKITVKAYNGKATSVTVTVKAAPAKVTLNSAEITLGAGETFALTATPDTAGSVTFASDDPAVDVDENTGLITAVSPGSATVTATAYNGVKALCRVTVKAAPGSVTLDPAEITLGVGESRNLPAVTLDAGSAGSYAFSSSDTYYATVDTKKGTFKAVRKTPAGQSVEIRATAYNGVQGALRLTIVDAPTGVSLSAPRKILGAKDGKAADTVQLKATLKPATAVSKLTYSSSNEKVATVDGNGVVTSVGKGSAKITVRTHNGKPAAVTITVKAAPAAITLNATERTLGVGESFRLTVSPDVAKGCELESDRDEVATVDESGLVTAVGTGTATITATTYNQKTAVCAITVKAAPKMVTLDPGAVTIGAGDTLDLPQVLFDGDSAGSYEYSTSDARYATITTVNKKKVIKAVRATPAGSPAEIRATAYNGVRGALKLTILAAPTGVSLSAPRKTLGADGDTVQLTATVKPAGAAETARLTYTSNNQKVATVDEHGVVTSVGKGTAKITVRTYNGKTYAITITVKKAPEAITLNRDALTLGMEESFQLTATRSAGSAGSYTFRTDDEGVAAVDEQTGEITARGLGTATITVETYNHVIDECAVTVKPAPTRITLDPASVVLGKGEPMDPPAVALFAGEDEAAGSYTYAPAESKYTQVLKNGQIKALNTTESTNVIFTTYNGVTAPLAVRIVAAPTKITLSADHTTLGVNETLSLATALSPASAASKRNFTSSKPSIATVDENGLVTAISPGSTKITVKTYNSKAASVTITVVPEPERADLPEALTLGLGEHYPIAPTMTPAGSGGGITYRTDDPEIATVEKVVNAKTKAVTYEIVAHDLGNTTVHVEMYNKVASSCALTVKQAPEGIHLDDENFTMSAKDTHQLLPYVLEGEDVASGTITYKSSNTAIAKVDANGLVTGVKAGAAKITVSTYNHTSNQVKVTVKDAVTSIKFAEEQHRLFIDREFKPEVIFSNKVPSNYTLESSDPTVAAIVGDDKRTVKSFQKPGTAEITATSYNGKVTKKKLVVFVPALPESGEVWCEPESHVLGEGDRYLLTVKMPEGKGAELRFTKTPGGNDVVELERVDNETVRVIARNKGQATITATTQNGVSCQARVEVKPAPTTLWVSPSTAVRSLQEKELKLSWGFGGDDQYGRIIGFTSNKKSIATVSDSGVVTFVKTGTVRISAETYNGHIAFCDLTIGKKPTKMSFDQGTYKIALGDSIRIPATFPKNCCESYSFTSEDEGIVSVVSGDVVHGEKLGTTTLTATSYSGLTATCQVEVVPAPTGIEAETQDVIELLVGANATKQLNARPLPDGVGSVHYMTRDPKVAVVNYSTGLVTPKGKGECEIVATTYNGYSVTYKIKVSYLLEGKRIGLDPGHQAQGDMGKEYMSPNSKKTKYRCAYSSSGVAHVSEHVINLQMCLKLRDALEKLGAEVYLTRETADVNISNRERAEMMNNLGVDFVLRIHCNAAGASSANGLSLIRRKTWAYSGKQEVNGKEVSGGSVMKKEENLGLSIAYFFRKETGCGWRGLGKSDEYTMNNWSKVPCLLVELGFMTNPTEGKKLVQEDYQQKMVQGLVKGICDYYKVPLPTVW